MFKMHHWAEIKGERETTRLVSVKHKKANHHGAVVKHTTIEPSTSPHFHMKWLLFSNPFTVRLVLIRYKSLKQGQNKGTHFFLSSRALITWSSHLQWKEISLDLPMICHLTTFGGAYHTWWDLTGLNSQVHPHVSTEVNLRFGCCIQSGVQQ